MPKPPRSTRSEVRGAIRTAVRDDGRTWLYLGGGPLVEHIAGEFVKLFPAGAVDVDIYLDEVWIYEPGMERDGYHTLGIRASVEFFRRE